MKDTQTYIQSVVQKISEDQADLKNLLLTSIIQLSPKAECLKESCLFYEKEFEHFEALASHFLVSPNGGQSFITEIKKDSYEPWYELIIKVFYIKDTKKLRDLRIKFSDDSRNFR